MISDINALRELFIKPTNQYRHLSIIHGFAPKERYTWEFDKKVIGENESKNYRDIIKSKLEELAELGFGGVVANVTPPDYLEDEKQWEIFLAGADETIKAGMRMWIYDEDGYPSGSAGGLVLRDNPEYEAQALVCMKESFGAGKVEFRPPSGWLYCVRAEITVDGTTQPDDITSKVCDDGYIRFDAPAGCVITRFDARAAFEGTHATKNVYRIRRYINVLNPKAVDSFFNLTAARYIEKLGNRIKHIEAVFTDEPSIMAPYFPELPDSIKPALHDKPADIFDRLPMIGWDNSLPDRFIQRWGYNLIPEMKSLFEGDDSRSVRVRHDFYQMLSEIYADTYFASQQAKLSQYNIAFTGHVLAEESIAQHAASEGNVMADLKKMQIPGIDILCSIPEEIMDSFRLLTCKYASSAAHAMNREQVMSESSNFEQQVAGRDVSIEERRGAAAVQMALGVTTITSYYTWKDIPAKDIKKVLDFWARLSAITRCGTHIAGIAVLYPIRTAWAHYTPVNEFLTDDVIDEPLKSMDNNLYKIARSIIRKGLDFDFLDTTDLIAAGIKDGKLCVGNESFSVLAIPPNAVMCPKDLEQIESFVKSSGTVVAFEPASLFAIPEISKPPKGRDIGPGKSPDEVLKKLQSEFPDKIYKVSAADEWLEPVKENITSGTRITPYGSHIIARRSVFDNAEIVLLVNGSKKDAKASVSFPNSENIELWGPMDGRTHTIENGETITIPGYAGVVVTGL